jgi:hypothetical protein
MLPGANAMDWAGGRNGTNSEVEIKSVMGDSSSVPANRPTIAMTGGLR